MTERREGRTSSPLCGFSVLSTPRFPVAALAALVSLAVGCGGGLPLLHPARTLAVGDVRALAGFSGTIAVGNLASAVRNAANEGAANTASQQGPIPGDIAYAEGALVAASVGPGLAPVAGARVGIGDQFEGGLAYTGRGMRADLRRSFTLSSTWDLSVGAGGSAALYGRAQTDALPGVDLGQLHGWGADVPVVVGYQSDGDLYMFWAGLRGGWEHVDISDVTSEPGSGEIGPTPISLSATRFWGGGLVGAAVGFRHVHVAMELDVSYATITGDFNDAHARIAGVTLAPATALWWSF